MTTKRCKICNTLITRDKFMNEHVWRTKIYCGNPCRLMGTSIRQLKKLGYTIKSPFESAETQSS